ncbi:MAG: response regulator [Atopobiaceae bacterium]|nr:response regulator [Atopobiaceae bacterium]
MLSQASLILVYLGSALMVYNIYGFVHFVQNFQSNSSWGADKRVLYLPVILLALFLMGYLAVGIFGNPDIVIGGILFGGSVFVLTMYLLLSRITQRVIENERLKAELLAVEQSNQAKTAFLASMSHEMRTPLNVIIGLDNIALRDSELPQRTRSQLEKINLSAHHLLDLINNVLDMNRFESGVLEADQEDFDLLEALNQVSAITETLCEQKGLTYHYVVDEGVSEFCRGDQVLLKQVLLSILNNAVKFTDTPGDVHFSVCVASHDDATQTVCFTVTDTGIGMEEDFLPHVFDAFTREDDSTTNRFGGGGLGLAVSKRGVELMNGRIEVRSVKGEGSTFTVTVPLIIIEPPEDVHPTLSENPAATSEADAPESDVEGEGLDGKRVLIVEDVEENAEIVADLLDLEGALSEHAENGQIAIQMLSQSDEWYYDALLMDLRMPVMDGLEAARRIRHLERPDAQHMPIIALTANAFQEDVQQSLEAGMDAHLAKPVDADLLFSTLERLIDQKSPTHD